MIEIGENVFVASRGVHLVGAESINDDGEHARVVVAEIHGHWNRQAGNEPDSVSVMLFANGADRMAGGLRLAVDAMRDTDPPPPPTVLDDWLDAARIITRRPRDDEAVAALSHLVEDLAERCDVFLDPASLRTMAFTLAAIQSAHLAVTELGPDDPGFAAGIVSALGLFACVVVDRLDGKRP